MDYNTYGSTGEKKVIPPLDSDITIVPRLKDRINYNDYLLGNSNSINFDKATVDLENVDRDLKVRKSISYGWNMGASSFFNFMGAVPGTADRFYDWLRTKKGLEPTEDSWMDNLQEYFDTQSIEYYQKAEEIGSPHGYGNRLIAELAQAPAAIVQYIPAMLGTGKYGINMKSWLRLPLSFAATDAIRVADEAPLWGADFLPASGTVGSEAMHGFGIGIYLAGASKIKNLPIKSTLLFGLGFVTAGDGFFPKTRADQEKRVAAGVTWALLGALDRGMQGKEPREKIIAKLKDGKKLSELTKAEKESIPEDARTLYQIFQIRTYIKQVEEIIKEGKKQGGDKLTTQDITNLEARIEKFEVERSRYEKVLYTLEEQTGIIHGLDQRPIEQVWQTTLKNLETAKDLPTVALAQKGFPGKYAADWYAGKEGNLLYRRVVDEVAAVHNKIENWVQNVLYSPEKSTKGYKIERQPGEGIFSFFQRNNYALTTFIPALTARRFLTTVKGMEGALTKPEILARKSIVQMDQVLQAGFKIEYEKAGKAEAKGEDYTTKKADGTFKYEVTDKELSEPIHDVPFYGTVKLNKSQIEAYRLLRKGDRESLDYFNKHARKVGYDRVQVIPNHMQRNWDGTFKLWMWSEGKQTKNSLPDHVYAANTKWGISKLKKKYKKIYPNADFSTVRRPKHTDYNSNISMFYDNINLLKAKGQHEAAEIMRLSGKELLKRKNHYAKYGQTRRDVKGYIGSVEKTAKERVNNYFKAYVSRITGAAQAIEYAKLNEFHRALFNNKKISTNFNNTKIFSKQYLDNFTGSLPLSKVDKWLGDLTQYFGDRGLAKFIGGLNLTQLHLRLMWWNYRFAASQGIQPYQMVIPKLVGLKADGYTNVDIGKVIVKSQKALFTPDKLEQDAVRYFGESGLVTAAFLREFIDHQSNFSTKVSPLNVGTISGYVSGRNLVATIEMNSRLNAGLMMYHFFKEAGLSHNTAKYRASYMANKVMVEYHLGERALMYGTAGLGFFGKMAGLFKTFQNNYFAQLANHVKDGKRTGDYSATGAYAISMITVAGLTGVIALEQADGLLRMLSPYWEKISGKRLPTVTEFVVTSDLPLFFKVGVPSAVMGGDMTATLAAPGLSVTDILSIPGLDYLGLNPFRFFAGQYTKGRKQGLFQAVVSGRNGLLLKILSDEASPDDAKEFYKLFAPTSFHGYIEAYYAGLDNPFLEFLGNDKYEFRKYLPEIDPKKNRGTFYRTKADWIRRFLSLRPVDEVLMMKLLYTQTLVKKDAAASFDNLLNLAISESLSDFGIGEIPLWIYEKALEDHGIDKKSFNLKVLNRYERITTTIQERTKDSKYIKTKVVDETIDNFYWYNE